jgi:hypothetical protein
MQMSQLISRKDFQIFICVPAFMKLGDDMTAAESKHLWQKIKQLRMRLSELEDAVLSPDDKRALAQARKELRAGKTKSHIEE